MEGIFRAPVVSWGLGFAVPAREFSSETNGAVGVTRLTTSTWMAVAGAHRREA